jgi:U3 small nucleolar RNA-associated protein 14
MDLSEMLGAGSDDEEDTVPRKNSAFETLLPDEEDENDGDADMLSFVSSLPTKKRKNMAEDGRGRKKRLSERTEAYDESEYSMSAHAQSSSGAKKKLDIADMMDALDDESGFGALKKNLRELEGSGKSKIKETLAAPLPKRIQDRLNRQAAYKEAKKEVGKWQPLVKQNREVC